MSTDLPAFQRPCLAAGGAGSSSVYVIGVSSTVTGRLEVYRVNINDINAPVATMIGSVTNATTWFAAAERYCDTFSGDRTTPSGAPIMIQQFGEYASATAMFFANGTVMDQYPNNSKKMSYKLFAPTGASGYYNWYTTLSNQADNSTLSPWMSLQYYDSPTVGGTYDYLLGNYPSTSALLAVGHFQPSTVSPAAGYVSVFEKTSGTVYSSSSLIKFDDLNRVQTLSSPFGIKMNDIVLTSDAYPVTMGMTGYIVDRAIADGSTILYWVNPSSGTFELKPVLVSGNVPPFYQYRGATGVGTQLVLYGGLLNGTPTTAFHLYDTISNEWSGPGLVKPVNPPTDGRGGNGNGNGSDDDGYGIGGGGTGKSSGNNTGAIVGGVIGAVVLIVAIVGFWWYRRSKRVDKTPTVPAVVTTDESHPSMQSRPVCQDYHKVPPTDIPYPPYQTAYPSAPVATPPYTVGQQPPTQPLPQQTQQQRLSQQASFYHQPPHLLPSAPLGAIYDPNVNNSTTYTPYNAAASSTPSSTTPSSSTGATIYQPPPPHVFSPTGPPPSGPQQHHSYMPPTLTTLDSSQQLPIPATTATSAIAGTCSSNSTVVVPTTPIEAIAPGSSASTGSSSGPFSPIPSQVAYSPTDLSYTSLSSPSTYTAATGGHPHVLHHHPYPHNHNLHSAATTTTTAAPMTISTIAATTAIPGGGLPYQPVSTPVSAAPPNNPQYIPPSI
ncbi:hypothetical protein DFQ26_001409 [Actinomortierella ambigua]|nr:hypothetical protein DFQ26_001409 [Actinomortierella ambigua]